ncbi:hypothetical protein ml_136 [Mollivirus sibericum]|uniref:hypothetical protein n=1 Tax=Mollivirus sibericum TaxID=1678078 RepID=UPI0006B2DEFF|nr:hypothetical protein ml_136 [Mollivirus sibericum]ALD61938.1 hypothetical protein ml_136 [Mollivirus sibericum]
MANTELELNKAINVAVADAIQETIDQVAKAATTRVEEEIRKFLTFRLCGDDLHEETEDSRGRDQSGIEILCQPASDGQHLPSEDKRTALVQANASQPMTIVFTRRCHALAERLIVEGIQTSTAHRPDVYDVVWDDAAFERDLKSIGLDGYGLLNEKHLAALLKNLTVGRRRRVVVRARHMVMFVGPSLATLFVHANRFNLDVFVLLDDDADPLLCGHLDRKDKAHAWRLDEATQRALKQDGFAVMDAQSYPKWMRAMAFMPHAKPDRLVVW